MSILDAFIDGAADTASFGFKDKLTGLAGLLAGKLGFAPDLGYDRYHDEAKARSDKTVSENPGTFLSSALLGGLATGGAGLARAPLNVQASLGALSAIGHANGEPITVDSLINSYQPPVMVGSMKRLKAPNLLSGKFDRPDMLIADLKLTGEGSFDKFRNRRALVGKHFNENYSSDGHHPDFGGAYSRDTGKAVNLTGDPRVSEHEGIHLLKDNINKALGYGELNPRLNNFGMQDMYLHDPVRLESGMKSIIPPTSKLDLIFMNDFENILGVNDNLLRKQLNDLHTGHGYHSFQIPEENINFLKDVYSAGKGDFPGYVYKKEYLDYLFGGRTHGKRLFNNLWNTKAEIYNLVDKHGFASGNSLDEILAKMKSRKR